MIESCPRLLVNGIGNESIVIFLWIENRNLMALIGGQFVMKMFLCDTKKLLFSSSFDFRVLNNINWVYFFEVFIRYE